jgi:flagellar biogenesis protein FliO
MATEHTTERTDGVTTERQTVVSDSGVAAERRGGGATGIVSILAILAVVAIVAWFLLNMNRQEAAETQAITGAAEQVGDSVAGAAESVGNAAERATQ